jgi:hypothetical protein
MDKAPTAEAKFVSSATKESRHAYAASKAGFLVQDIQKGPSGSGL